MNFPPDISRTSPVIKEAASEAKNTTGLATSLGTPMRCTTAVWHAYGSPLFSIEGN